MSTPQAPATDPPFVVGVALLGVACLGVMANAAVAPALPGIKTAFADTAYVATLIGLVISLPSFGIIATAGIGGSLCDRFGRRPVMIGAILLYAVAGLSALFATALWQVLLGRLLLGISIGGTMTSASAMIADRYQGPARIRLMSLQTTIMSGSSMAFLVIGGFLGELGWRAPFLVYVAGFLVLPLVWWYLAESKQATSAAKALEPFRSRPYLDIGISALLSMILYYLLPTQLPFHLNAIGITSPSTIGITIAAGTLTMASMAYFYPRTAQGLHPRTIYMLLFGFAAVGNLMIGFGTTLPVVVLGSAIAGAGCGWLFPLNNILIAQRAPEHMRGRASGFHTTCIFTGQFISPLVGAPIAERLGYGQTFVLAGIAAAVICAAYAFWRVRGEAEQRRA